MADGAASSRRFGWGWFGGWLGNFGGGHGAVGDGDLPVGVVGVEGFHGADDLLAERGFDQAALAGPDLESHADKIPAAARCGFDTANCRLAEDDRAELPPHS